MKWIEGDIYSCEVCGRFKRETLTITSFRWLAVSKEEVEKIE